MYVCLCRGITDNQIRKAVQAGKTEFKQLKQSLEVGTQCGKCVRMAMEIIAAEVDKMESEQAPLYYEVPLPDTSPSEGYPFLGGLFAIFLWSFFSTKL